MPTPFQSRRELQQIPDQLTTLNLTATIRIVYEVSNKYFIITITFACLIVVMIGILITLIILYKRKKQEYNSFLLLKQKKMKGEFEKYVNLVNENNNDDD